MKDILIGSLILWGFFAQIQAQENSLFVKKSGVTQIVLYDGKTPKTIFQTDKKAVYDIKVSPKNQYISAIEVTEGVVEGHGYKVLPKNRLVVISPNGELQNVINEDIRKYDWSPSGEKIVCITGSYSETELGFRPDGGMFIYNLSTKEKKSIRGLRYPHDVYWGVDENLIYIKDVGTGKGVFRYRVDSNDLELTGYHSVYFSPNEAYYNRYSSTANDFAVFETKTNRTIQLPTNLGKPIKWVFNQGNYLLFENKNETLEFGELPKAKRKPDQFEAPTWTKVRTLNSVTYTIYDVRKAVVVKEELTNMVSDWIGDKYSLPIQKKGKAIKKLTLE